MKNNKVAIIVGVVLALAGIATAVYFLSRPSRKSSDERKNSRRITFTRQ